MTKSPCGKPEEERHGPHPCYCRNHPIPPNSATNLHACPGNPTYEQLVAENEKLDTECERMKYSMELHVKEREQVEMMVEKLKNEIASILETFGGHICPGSRCETCHLVNPLLKLCNSIHLSPLADAGSSQPYDLFELDWIARKKMAGKDLTSDETRLLNVPKAVEDDFCGHLACRRGEPCRGDNP